MTIPLSNLLQKNVPWILSDSCQEAFDNLKAALTSAPSLSSLRLESPLRSFVMPPALALGQFFSKMAGFLLLKAGSCW